MQYGGFWIRALAYLIDGVILGIAQWVIFAAMGQSMFDPDPATVSALPNVLSGLLGLAYFVAFEASSWQGTPGKRALGLIVTDMDGNRISVLRAVGRYFAKILSALILLIGFIMVAFTERKQGLHDIICSTLVLKANPGEGALDTEVFE